jgi:UDP-N-acetylmuramate dehydrogenase
LNDTGSNANWIGELPEKRMSIVNGLEHILRENEPLAPYTRLGLGGVAEYFAEPTSEGELIELVVRFSSEQLPIRLIGAGSNIVVRNEGVPGLVIRLSAPDFCHLDVDGNRLTSGGGVRLSHFVATAVREGFSGPEHLVGIPGTVGGALHCNIGSQGVDIGSWVQTARVLTRTGGIVDRSCDTFSFAYRQSGLDELVILQAVFAFEREKTEILTKQMQKIWIVRRAAQPLTENAIYAFKNEGPESAADLIDRSGLKGTSVGQVAVSERNANLFIAHPGATSQDVLRLLELVKNQVADRSGAELQPAIEIW